MNDIWFDVDAFILSGSLGNTTFLIQTLFLKKVKETAENLQANRIVTNGNLASVLQDSALVQITPLTNAMINYQSQIYPVGIIGAVDIFVDPNQKWTDNYIHFEYYEKNKSKLRKMKIKSVENTVRRR